HAVLNAMLPCELGGAAIADILLGSVNPSGRLPFTYPKTMADSAVPYYHRQNLGCLVNKTFGECEHEWPFGAGLSYTTFEYSNVSLSVAEGHTVDINVTVRNAGSVAGQEVVLLFVRQDTREGNVPETKRLIKFEKIQLGAGNAKVVQFRVGATDVGIYTNTIGRGLHRVVTDGNYTLLFKADTKCNSSMPQQPLCATFQAKTVSTSKWGYSS
ncbi:hypothetical protein DYB28_015259, partial [Aphanomyces astaci]